MGPDFYIIPGQLVEDKTLDPIDRLLYGVIYWYEHLKEGRCFASNETLAKILKTTVRVVQRSLNRLEEGQYINRSYKDTAKRNRLSIQTMIAFKYARKSERPTGRSGTAHKPLASGPQATRVGIADKNELIETPPSIPPQEKMTPGEEAQAFFDPNSTLGKDIMESLVAKHGENSRQAIFNEGRKFFLYWTEPNKSGTKRRFELEKTFDVRRRLHTWLSNAGRFNKRSIRAGAGITI